jgi:hypothetical protein
MPVCEYCGRTLSNMSNLRQHQKTASYCLASREKINADFSCKYCDRIFTQKNNMLIHQEKCSAKNVSEDLDKFKKRIFELEIENKNLIAQLEREIDEKNKLQLALENLAQRGIDKPTSVTNKINNKIKITTGPLIMDPKIFTEKIRENLTLNDVESGPTGLARFTTKTLLYDDNEKLTYTCTDRSRRTFHYVDEHNTVQKDPKAEKLWSHIKEPLIQQSIEKIKEKYEDEDLLLKSVKIDDLTKNNKKFVRALANITATNT